MEIYLDTAVLPLLVGLLLHADVADRLEDVTNIRASAHQDSQGSLRREIFIVLKDVGGGRHAPELNVANLVDYLHHFK